MIGSCMRRGHAMARGSRMSTRWCAIACAVASAMLIGSGCEKRLPLTWKTAAEPAAETPAGFDRLWNTHCAGCHGADGSHGPARPMRDPVYLASVSDADLVRVISSGSSAGTLMPGFAISSGGALSDQEIAAIVSGMRRAWGRTDAKASSISYAAPAGSSAGGDPHRGEAAFGRWCITCHATGNATDPFFLQLVSDQALRSAIIFGRTDLGMPGADGPFPDRSPSERMTAQEVDDIVAWLIQRRSQDWPPKSIRRGGTP